MRLTVVIIIWLLSQAALTAQDYDESYHMYSGCSGEYPSAIWEVRGFRSGVTAVHKPGADLGTVKFYDHCIEINCRSLLFTFEIESRTKVNDTYSILRRKTTDASYNYMEIREMINSPHKGLYQIFLCLMDDNDVSQDTIVLTCRPYKI